MGISCEIFTEFCFFKWDRRGSQLVVRLVIFSMISHFNNSSVLTKARSIEKKKTKRKYEIKKSNIVKNFSIEYKYIVFKPKLLLPWILNSCCFFVVVVVVVVADCFVQQWFESLFDLFDYSRNNKLLKLRSLYIIVFLTSNALVVSVCLVRGYPFR